MTSVPLAMVNFINLGLVGVISTDYYHLSLKIHHTDSLPIRLIQFKKLNICYYKMLHVPLVSKQCILYDDELSDRTTHVTLYRSIAICCTIPIRT